MRNEILLNQLEYLEGGMILIKKKLKELRIKFIRFQFNQDDIKQYKQTKLDYRLVSSCIKSIKNMIKDEEVMRNA